MDESLRKTPPIAKVPDVDRTAQARRLGLGPLSPQPLSGAGEVQRPADTTARSEIRKEVTDAAL